MESPRTGCSEHRVVWRRLPAKIGGVTSRGHPHRTAGRQHRRGRVSLPNRPFAVTVGGLTSLPRPPRNAVAANSRPLVTGQWRGSLRWGGRHLTGHPQLPRPPPSPPVRRHAPSHSQQDGPYPFLPSHCVGTRQATSCESWCGTTASSARRLSMLATEGRHHRANSAGRSRARRHQRVNLSATPYVVACN